MGLSGEPSPAELTRRPAFGETSRDDWVVVFDGVAVGRIRHNNPGLPGPPWIWEISILSHRGARHGTAATLEAARDDFFASWRQLRLAVHEAEMRSELEHHRRTEARMQLLAERNGPWPPGREPK